MADKDRTPPDLLGSLLTGKKAPVQEDKPAEPAGAHTEATEAFTGLPERVKATYYLPTSLLARLDEVWLQLRRATGQRVSKGEIIETALEMALEQMEELTRRIKSKK